MKDLVAIGLNIAFLIVATGIFFSADLTIHGTTAVLECENKDGLGFVFMAPETDHIRTVNTPSTGQRRLKAPALMRKDHIYLVTWEPSSPQAELWEQIGETEGVDYD